ncbi:hypothetical protein [Novosphingobium album (ex Liu et al. 2023)]|uniref:Uncharacterized protein n=1 Tax=Novosphingobium album (ex Liu et al. 2023) TaxID=3031130 RepID=A0ABT5WMS7_9SPHN|nr:hypothetical protein [Novosphingobium album (ex Liu et al. 2023)]MDE8650577.1 hypothetical protein [Novosphingobium album (ex Liu et al. 2023)]
MHVEFEISGSFDVPAGTGPVDGSPNLFHLPSGQIVSVHPVMEMASSPDSDDHRDLTTAEAARLGIHLDLYDRDACLRGGD